MIRNKIRYLAVLIIVGLLSILYNDYHMGMIFLSAAALPFLLFVLLSLLYGMVTAQLVSVVHVANKGEKIPVSIQINNPTVFPIPNISIYITYRNTFSGMVTKKEVMVSADRKTKTTVTCNILSEHAGNLEISLAKLRIYDYLKLFSLSRKQKGVIKVAVLPSFHELTDEYLTNRCRMLVESDYYSPVKSGDDPSEVFAIREYREGDRPQRIHWKLSMKQGQLMIKDFSDPLNCSVLIFANLSVPENENVLVYMDALLECALSLSYTFLLRGQMHYFSWYDKAHGVCRRVRVITEKDLFEALDGLLQAGSYSDGTDVITAYLAEHPNDQYTDLLYVTGEISQIQLDSISMIKAVVRKVIYVNEAGNHSNNINLSVTDEMEKKLAEMGIGLLPVDAGNVRKNLDQLRIG